VRCGAGVGRRAFGGELLGRVVPRAEELVFGGEHLALGHRGALGLRGRGGEAGEGVRFAVDDAWSGIKKNI